MQLFSITLYYFQSNRVVKIKEDKIEGLINNGNDMSIQHSQKNEKSSFSIKNVSNNFVSLDNYKTTYF